MLMWCSISCCLSLYYPADSRKQQRDSVTVDKSKLTMLMLLFLYCWAEMTKLNISVACSHRVRGRGQTEQSATTKSDTLGLEWSCSVSPCLSGWHHQRKSLPEARSACQDGVSSDRLRTLHLLLSFTHKCLSVRFPWCLFWITSRYIE